jgi:hypothetical protein
MFALVVDTSLMNVSISAVVHDLDTTVSGVQSAIALALAAYGVGAIAMTLAQGRRQPEPKQRDVEGVRSADRVQVADGSG